MSRNKKSKMENIMNQINKDLDVLNIYKIDKDLENSNLNKSIENKKVENKSFISYNSDTNSIQSVSSKISQVTYVSEPFKDDKDLDLPNFSPMKYTPFRWRISHSSTYLIYSLILLISTILWISGDDNDNNCNTLMLIAHCFYLISAFIQWFYFKRGCIGYANHNSRVKANIDKSLKAKILRSEEGWKYFFSLFAVIILIFGNIYFISSGKESNPEYWNINLIGCMIISLSQIMKIEKILIENKSYMVHNDLSHSLVEIFMFFGSLSYGSYYFIQILYDYDRDILRYLFKILKLFGNGFIIFSSICLLDRYFCSSFDDLNISDLSNATL